jgi:hypothetical protein
MKYLKNGLAWLACIIVFVVCHVLIKNLLLGVVPGVVLFGFAVATFGVAEGVRREVRRLVDDWGQNG